MITRPGTQLNAKLTSRKSCEEKNHLIVGLVEKKNPKEFSLFQLRQYFSGVTITVYFGK